MSDSDKIQQPKGKYQYQCLECKKIIHQFRQIKDKRSACKDCCVKYNNGKWCEKYIFIKVIENETGNKNN